MSTQRPNIIFITSDQHRADCLGVAGRKVKTPNLDAMAKRGTRFTNAITPCVVCQPARASILTGLLPRTHGVHDNGIDLDKDIGAAGFAGTLTKAGYNTSFFGKAHFGTNHSRFDTGCPEAIICSDQYGPDWFGPYMGFEHVELMLLGHNYFAIEKPPLGLHYEAFYHADGKGDDKDGLYRGDGSEDTKGAAQTFHSRIPLEWHNTTWTADRAIDWIEQQDGEEPFCTWISFPDPHHPFDAPKPWSDLHKPEDVDLPPHRTRNFEGKPWWHEKSLTQEPGGTPEQNKVRKEYSRIPPQTDEQLREIIANTYGQISFIDEQVGRIYDTLEAQGIADNTIVVFSSDHGDWLGDHGLILKGPMHYEGLLKVPCIITGPGVKANQVVEDPVSTMDFAPTFADYAGTELRTNGESLRALAQGEDAPREYAYNEWDLLPARTGVTLNLRTVKGKRFKLTVDLASKDGEMYDLQEDPYELVNLYNNADYAEQQAQLMAWIEARPDDMLPLGIQVGPA